MYQNLKNKDVIAKKRHVCDWCGKNINKGEKYNYQTFIFDGDFCDWHSHLSCSHVASAIWDYVDPDDGMDSDAFIDGCADVCGTFICPDCKHYNKEFQECDKDESYCIDIMDDYFKTHELYAERKGYYSVWKSRELQNRRKEQSHEPC